MAQRPGTSRQVAVIGGGPSLTSVYVFVVLERNQEEDNAAGIQNRGRRGGGISLTNHFLNW